MTNIKKEIAFYEKEITADDLQHYTRITIIIDEFDEFEFNEFDDTPENPDLHHLTLV